VLALVVAVTGGWVSRWRAQVPLTAAAQTSCGGRARFCCSTACGGTWARARHKRFRYNRGVPKTPLSPRFIVRASLPTGKPHWLSIPDGRTMRSLVDRNGAAEFQNPSDAQAAIMGMPAVLNRMGMVFEIQQS
jgi:hypothetical protein